MDLDSVPVHPPTPGAALFPQYLEIWDPSGSQALSREEANFDFRLIQPTAVRGRVVNGEAVPNLAAKCLAVEVG